MPLVILLRHGRTAANTEGVLAGWTPGVGLDEVGRAQAAAVAERLAAAPVCRVVSSPLQRTLETASPLAERLGLHVVEEADLGECRYGAWTGRSLKDLATETLWAAVQGNPSGVTFPASPEWPGESLAAMSARAVGAIRRVDAQVAAEHGEGACWVAVSHGDVIKAVLADALGTHLDQFQRIQVDPGSVSQIRYAGGRPTVLGINGDGSAVARHAHRPAPTAPGEGVVGGGAG